MKENDPSKYYGVLKKAGYKYGYTGLNVAEDSGSIGNAANDYVYKVASDIGVGFNQTDLIL